MKELFNTLSGVSNFFNEKRFIFGVENPEPQPAPKVSPGKIEFPEMVIKANTQKKGKELVANSKLNKLMDRALAEGKVGKNSIDYADSIDRAIGFDRWDALQADATKSLAGLGNPDELVGRLGGGNEGREYQVLDDLGNQETQDEEAPPIASLDKNKDK